MEREVRRHVRLVTIPRIGPCPKCGASVRQPGDGACPQCGAAWEYDVQVTTTPAPRGIIGVGIGIRFTPKKDEKEPRED